MISQREAYQTYQRCGSVHLTAEALGQKPADVREKLKRYMESRGLDASRFHQPTQTEKIEAYSAQSLQRTLFMCATLTARSRLLVKTKRQAH